jgi:hypothetical protein
MNITLDANPSDAPGCVRIVADDGRDRLIQVDYDFPGIANTFRWNIQAVQLPGPEAYEAWQTGADDLTPEEIAACEAYDLREPCQHDGTDGTVPCKKCGLQAGDFISAARQWLDDHDGAEAEDPGYFD